MERRPTRTLVMGKRVEGVHVYIAWTCTTTGSIEYRCYYHALEKARTYLSDLLIVAIHCFNKNLHL